MIMIQHCHIIYQNMVIQDLHLHLPVNVALMVPVHNLIVICLQQQQQWLPLARQKLCLIHLCLQTLYQSLTSGTIWHDSSAEKVLLAYFVLVFGCWNGISPCEKMLMSLTKKNFTVVNLDLRLPVGFTSEIWWASSCFLLFNSIVDSFWHIESSIFFQHSCRTKKINLDI